jgi:hypothetical protein
MKKKYFKPEVDSDEMFEQTANQTGYNINEAAGCDHPNLINENDGCPGPLKIVNDGIGCEAIPPVSGQCLVDVS